MRTDTAHYQGAIFNNVLLPGTILLANIDMTGLLDYALKALAGGAIWLGFKLAGEYFERRKKQLEEKKPSKPSRNRKSQKAGNGITE
ncbi:MAG: hypothetical protein J7621_22440 [Niastella sp.]|nr:hypothetical protein [Niastella sp.]